MPLAKLTKGTPFLQSQFLKLFMSVLIKQIFLTLQQISFIDKRVDKYDNPLANPFILFPDQPSFSGPKITAGSVTGFDWGDIYDIVTAALTKARKIVGFYYFNHIEKTKLPLNSAHSEFSEFIGKVGEWQNQLSGTDKILFIFVSGCFSKNIFPTFDALVYPNIHIMLTSKIDKTISRNAYIFSTDRNLFTELPCPSIRKLGLSLNNPQIRCFAKLCQDNAEFGDQFEFSYGGSCPNDEKLFESIFGPTPLQQLTCIGPYNNHSVFYDEASNGEKIGANSFVSLESRTKISVSNIPSAITDFIKKNENSLMSSSLLLRF